LTQRGQTARLTGSRRQAPKESERTAAGTGGGREDGKGNSMPQSIRDIIDATGIIDIHEHHFPEISVLRLLYWLYE
jgi:hypothetical protein